MARGSDQANTAATSGQNLSNQLAGNANALYSNLAPELASEAANPSGYTPAELAKQNTAVEQSAGGSEAGAVGQGALLASRTRNAGTADAAIESGVRGAGENLAKGALATQIGNAELKQKQRQAALGEEGSLYGTSVSGANSALGEVAGNVNANTNAENASWDWSKDLLAPILQASAGAYAGR